MRAICLFIVTFIVSIASSAQIFNIQSGASFSKLVSRLDGGDTHFLEGMITDFSVFAGVEYFNRKYFSISSNAGYITKGGKEPAGITDNNGNLISTYTLSERFNYISVNSTFNVKYPIREKLVPFISLGPRVDFLVSHGNQFPYFDSNATLSKRSYGLVGGAGIKYQVAKLQVGLRGDYLINFNSLAKTDRQTNRDKTYLISATVGYRLK